MDRDITEFEVLALHRHLGPGPMAVSAAPLGVEQVGTRYDRDRLVPFLPNMAVGGGYG